MCAFSQIWREGALVRNYKRVKGEFKLGWLPQITEFAGITGDQLSNSSFPCRLPAPAAAIRSPPFLHSGRWNLHAGALNPPLLTLLDWGAFSVSFARFHCSAPWSPFGGVFPSRVGLRAWSYLASCFVCLPHLWLPRKDSYFVSLHTYCCATDRWAARVVLVLQRDHGYFLRLLTLKLCTKPPLAWPARGLGKAKKTQEKNGPLWAF